MKLVTGFFMAWGSFCAIPCPCRKWDEAARRHMLIMFPVIGLMLGLLWYALFALIKIAGLPTPLSAALMTAYPFLVSGFIHLDGFMDCNDAILSRRPLQERQRILKDSHVGAFAVITAILLFMVFFASMWSALERGDRITMLNLIAIPVLSRAVSAGAILAYRPLAVSQYQKTFVPVQNRKYIGCITMIWLSAALLLIIGGAQLADLWGAKPMMQFLRTSIGLVAAELTVSLLSGVYARKQLGGMSGDIAGYMLVFSELAAVIALAVI